MPQLSVHMAVRNGAENLKSAVTSTLLAMPRDSELLVLDDASTDHPELILSGVRDRRLRYIRRESSQGIGVARQIMLLETDSEYVATMDADDICLPWRFSAQLPHLHRKADMVFSPVVRFSVDPLRIRVGLPLPIASRAMALHLLIHNLLSNPTMVARRAVVVDSGGYRNASAEDYDLWLRALARNARLVRTSLPGIAYRHHASQTSRPDSFRAQALSESELRDAYTKFCAQSFGVVPTWLDSLWSTGSNAEVFKDLKPVIDLVRMRARDLPVLQRYVLWRTLRLLDMRRG